MIDILDLKVRPLKFNSVGIKPMVGGIGTCIEATIDLIVHWEVVNFDCTLYENQIISNDGIDFASKGFQVGDTVVLVYDELSSASSLNEGTFIVTAISGNTMWVTWSDSTSGTFGFDLEVGSIYSVYGTTPITCLDYYFGLVENADSAAYVSLLDGEVQKYRADGVDSTALGTVALIPNTTNKSWVTGSNAEQAYTIVTESGTGTSDSSTGYEQRFIITHVFHVSPAILNGWESDSGALNEALVSWFNGSNALKFIPRVVAGFVTGGSDHTTDEGNLSYWLQNGDNGFYDEFRNGGAPTYTLTSIDYEGTRTELAKNENTDVEIVITKTTGSFDANSRFDLYIFQLPPDNATVSNNTDDVWTNFEVSNVFMTPAAGAIAHNLITDATVTILAGVSTINFTYTAPDNDNKYIIFCDVGDSSIVSASDGDNMPVLCDYREFEIYVNVDGILVFDNVLINEESTDDLTKAYTDYKGWIEDGILATPSLGQEAKFALKKLVGDSLDWICTLGDVSVNVTVEHATDSTRNFVLENISLSNPENSTRSYLLNSTDPKNYLTFNELTSDTDYRYYALQYATKIQWMNWETITTDPDFTTSTRNWSLYDLPPNWQIYLNIVIGADLVNGDNEETYTRTHKVELNVKDYEIFNNCEISGVIRTYITSTGGLTGGQISKTENTTVIASFYGEELFPCIYQELMSNSHTPFECEYEELLSGSGSYSNGEGNLADCPEYYGILELDIPNGNPLTIDAIFTNKETATTTAWIGQIATNRAKITMYPYASPPRIDVEAVIDYTLLNTTLPYYKLSARLGKEAQTICQISIMQFVAAGTSEYTATILSSFTTLGILVFNIGYELTSIAEAVLTGDTVDFNPVISRIMKICCSKDAITGTTSGGGTKAESELVGLTQDNFIAFVGLTGVEVTTLAATTFNSGLGLIGGLPTVKPIKISFHDALISTSVSAVPDYTHIVLMGLTIQQIMVFVNGVEQTTLGATLSGGTITFPSTVSGLMKIVLVNQ